MSQISAEITQNNLEVEVILNEIVVEMATTEVALSNLTPITVGTSGASAGVSPRAAREDHIHQINTAQLYALFDPRYAGLMHTHTESDISDLDKYTQAETDTLLAGKASAVHTHDDRYYTEGEMDTALSGKSDTSHNHDTRYYTETEIDMALTTKANSIHSHIISDVTNLQSTLDGKFTLQSANVVNESGADVDQRFEGDTDTNLLFLDASTDRIGIGTDIPQVKLHAVGEIRGYHTDNTRFIRVYSDASWARISHGGGNSGIVYSANNHQFEGSGDIIVNTTNKTITTASNNVLTIAPNGTGHTRIGNAGSTSHTFNTNDDLFVTGRLEVDGTTYFDGNIIVKTSQVLNIGDTGATGFSLKDTGGQTDCLMTFVGATDNYMLITPFANRLKDHDHPAQTNPTIFVHSATDPDVSNNQWVSLSHNQSDALLSAGTGSIVINTKLKPTSGTYVGTFFAADGNGIYCGSDSAHKFVLRTTDSDRITVDADGTNTTFATHILPSADSSKDLGTSSIYWANTYTDKIYLNATATLDGSTAGRIIQTGQLSISNNLADSYAWEVGGTAIIMATNSPYNKYQAAMRGLITNSYYAGDRTQILIGVDFGFWHGTGHDLGNGVGNWVSSHLDGVNSTISAWYGFNQEMNFWDNSGQVVDNFYGYGFSSINRQNGSTNVATISNFIMFYMPFVGATNVTITNKYGVYIADTGAKNYFGGEVELDGALNHDGSTVGFYGTAPVAKQTGVAVTAAGIHAALVSLGLIAA